MFAGLAAPIRGSLGFSCKEKTSVFLVFGCLDVSSLTIFARSGDPSLGRGSPFGVKSEDGIWLLLVLRLS